MQDSVNRSAAWRTGKGTVPSASLLNHAHLSNHAQPALFLERCFHLTVFESGAGRAGFDIGRLLP